MSDLDDRRPHEGPVRIIDVRPDRASFTTGTDWAVSVELDADAENHGRLTVRALNPAAEPVEVTTPVHLAAGRSVVCLTLPAPGGQPAGWQLAAEYTDRAGWRVSGTGALDVLDDWREDPRYGFLCEFGPDSTGVAHRAAAMRRYHLTCVQLYDWAYRHHQLLPREDTYADVLDRRLSLPAVRAAVDAVHAEGMAALGYATVYAAEAEFTAVHPDWQLYDDQGRPCHLADLFFLMDLSPQSGWPEHMLEQLRTTLDALAFDGFHLDQYGYPRAARSQSGEIRETADGFVDFVARANQQAAQQRPTGGHIFNNVNAWPLDRMAPVAQIANYLEVWRPHTDYRDLVELTGHARQVAPDRPVLLAAYAGFLRKDAAPSDGAGGLALLTAVTLAAGAWPLLLGEGDNILTGGYYPEYVALSPEARAIMTALLDVGVAWREFLRGPDCRRVADAFIDGQDAELALDHPYSSRPLPGHVWVSMIRRPGWIAVSLVNLADAVTPRWNQPQPLPAPRTVHLTLPQGVDASRCWVAGDHSAWTRAATGVEPGGWTVAVDLGIWSLVVLPLVETVE